MLKGYGGFQQVIERLSARMISAAYQPKGELMTNFKIGDKVTRKEPRGTFTGNSIGFIESVTVETAEVRWFIEKDVNYTPTYDGEILVENLSDLKKAR